jgi:hypothetical protein
MRQRPFSISLYSGQKKTKIQGTTITIIETLTSNNQKVSIARPQIKSDIPRKR